MTPLFSKRSQRRPRASQFDGRYWDEALEVTRFNRDGRTQAAERFPDDAVRGTRAARDAWRAGVTHATVQYSAGLGIDDIGGTVALAGAQFADWTTRATGLQGAPPRLDDGNDYYFDVLRLVGLAIGCGVRDAAERILVAVAEQGADGVFSRLGAAQLPGVAAATTPRPARQILSSLDLAKDPIVHLQSHLDDWSTRLTAMPWMGSLKRTQPGDVDFIGYWAFEIVGAARARGVHAADLRGDVVPVDLLSSVPWER